MHCSQLQDGLDRVSTELADAYKAFLQFVVDSLDSAEEEYFFLIHESISDEALIKDLRLGRDPAIVMHHNPLIIKAVIGDSRFLIGSRYHALVSGLSQGVPSLGTGWNHKYPTLFGDFGMPQLYQADITDLLTTARLLKSLRQHSQREQVSLELRAHTALIHQQIMEMWDQVELLLSRNHPAAAP